MSPPPRPSTEAERPISSANFPRSGHVTWGNPFGNYFSQTALPSHRSRLRKGCVHPDVVLQQHRNRYRRRRAEHHPAECGARAVGHPGIEPDLWSRQLEFRCEPAEEESGSPNREAWQFRLDARNIFNHPTPGTPNLNINSGTFGQITTKTGNRTLAGQIRLEF